MDEKQRVDLLSTVQKLAEETKYLAMQISSGIYSNEFRVDICKGDYQKNINLIARSCEILKDDYKKNIMKVGNKDE